MELYKRLPNELQQIIKYYTLCSPHKQSLAIKNERVYNRLLYDDVNILDCFITDDGEEDDYRVIITFGDMAHYYFTHENIYDENTTRYIQNHRLLWYYYNHLTREVCIDFINSNMTISTRDMLCSDLNKRFCDLNRIELNAFKYYIYDFV
jgi:hypothetical protein